MANRENLPGISSTLTDGNLNKLTPGDYGDSILIIGTSQRGPINSPRPIRGIEDAINYFGSASVGNLVRSAAEAINAPGGDKDIRLVRISNGIQAKLDLTENRSRTGINAEYDSVNHKVSLKLVASEKSDIFNDTTIRIDNINSQECVVIYNPISDVESAFPFDTTGNTAGVSKTVSELATAINIDTNISEILSAEATEFETKFEIYCNSGVLGELSGWLDFEDISTDLNLASGMSMADTNNDGYPETGVVNKGTGNTTVKVTSGNKLININECYSLENYTEALTTKGSKSTTLEFPVQVVGTTAKPLLDVDTETTSGDGVARHIARGTYVGTGDGATVAFSFTAYEPIDIAEVDEDGNTIWKIYVTGDSGVKTDMTSVVTLTNVGGSGTGYMAKITFTGGYIPAIGTSITGDYNSEEITMSQSTTLAACNATSSYKTYFIAGDTIHWGAVQPNDIKIAYSAKRILEEDKDVFISDAWNGVVQFSNTDNAPAFPCWIYFDINYEPEWINLSGAAQTLSGGTNGVSMSNKTKYDSLTAAYTELADYEVDIVVPAGVYIDDTKTIYDPTTGVPVTVNAGFASQLAEYCEGLSDGVNETFGIIGVVPPVNTEISTINSWYEGLSETSTNDTTRGANVMAGFSSQYVDVVAYEPIFNNTTIGYPYSANGSVHYAGLQAKLNTGSAPTHKTLGSGIAALRYKLSSRQLNELTGLRYVTAFNSQDRGDMITDGVTASAVTSDWTRAQTRKLVFDIMDNIRRVGQPFIGEAFTDAKKAALTTQIQKGLMSLKESGLVREFTFSIEQTPQEEVAGTARIPLTIYPAFELRKIDVVVKLTNS